MWGGRFGAGPAEVMREINASIPVDKRLWRQDIAGSKAHARMLAAQGILTAADVDAIIEGLDTIERDYETNGVPEHIELEDIHMQVESRLKDLIGEAAGRLHTARSRNDQVATDFRLWVRGACAEVDKSIAGLRSSSSYQVFKDPMQACAGADLVTTDVWTSMGYEAENEARRAAFARWCVSPAMMAVAQPDALFMHCLPAHRGEEVAAEVIDGPQSVVWDEAENRMHVHKALMEYLLLGRVA